MSKQMEGLIEKIVSQLYAVIEYAEQAESGIHKHRQLEIWAGWITESVLSAVRDGLEIPGERSRYFLSFELGKNEEAWAAFDEWVAYMIMIGGTQFIALSPTETSQGERGGGRR